MPKPQPSDEAPLQFDRALEQVEEIIRRIESGEIGLEDAIREYERGAELIRGCRETLAKAEQRVKDVTARMQADLAAGAKGGPPEPDEEGSPF